MSEQTDAGFAFSSGSFTEAPKNAPQIPNALDRLDSAIERLEKEVARAPEQFAGVMRPGVPMAGGDGESDTPEQVPSMSDLAASIGRMATRVNAAAGSLQRMMDRAEL
jgi:hypothetical protein